MIGMGTPVSRGKTQCPDFNGCGFVLRSTLVNQDVSAPPGLTRLGRECHFGVPLVQKIENLWESAARIPLELMLGDSLVTVYARICKLPYTTLDTPVQCVISKNHHGNATAANRTPHDLITS